MSDLEPIKKNLQHRVYQSKKNEDIHNTINLSLNKLGYYDFKISHFKNNKLSLKAESSALASDLNLQKNQIISVINKELPPEFQIKILTIVTG